MSKNIADSYQDLIKGINSLVSRGDGQSTGEGMSIPIDKSEANDIYDKIDTLRENINTFNYYTAFYPNKEITWNRELELVKHISNILDKLEIEKNIREV